MARQRRGNGSLERTTQAEKITPARLRSVVSAVSQILSASRFMLELEVAKYCYDPAPEPDPAPTPDEAAL